MPVASEYGSNVADFIFRVAGAGGQQQDLGPETLRVVSFQGREGLNEPYHYRVELSTDGLPIELDPLVGAGCHLEMRGEGSVRVVHGVIRQFERSGQGSRALYYVAEVVPQHWFLSRRFNCRIFQKSTCEDMTVPGILRKVLEDAGIEEKRFDLSRLTVAFKPREYVVQYRESDLDFLTRLCEDEGIYFWFEHSAEDYKIVFGDVKDAHKHVGEVYAAGETQQNEQADSGDGAAALNDPVLTFREPGGLVHDRFSVYELRARASAEIGSVALDDYEFLKPDLDLMTDPQNAPRFTALNVYDYPAGRIEMPDGAKEGQIRLEPADARIRLEAHQASRWVVRMSSDARHLACGAWFTLTDHSEPTYNVDYLITALNVSGTQTQSTEEEQSPVGGNRFEMRVTCIPKSVQYRAPRVTPRPLVQGSQTAVVVKQKDNEDEIYVDEHGRVKVQFHWDHEQPPEDSSMFVRVSQGWAGAGWGMMFLPRVGQEVIVDHLEGDPDRPMITGRVYNRTHMPPYKLPDEKTKSTIKTYSTEDSKRFHEIRFEDKNQNEQLFIRAQRRMDTRVLGTHYHTAGGSLHELIGGEDDQGNKYGSYYRTTYKGEHFHNKLDHYQWIEDLQNVRIDKDVLHWLQQNYALFVKEKFEINAKELVIEMKEKIALKVGGNFIVIDQQGVTIVGTKVKINSGGSAPTVADRQMDGPYDAIPADTGKPGKRGKGGKPRTRPSWKIEAQHAPPPPPPPDRRRPPVPPVVPPDLKCALLKITAQCEHKSGGARIVTANMTLEVVPGSSFGKDRIDLAAEVQLLCGPKHPEWSITNESSRTGLATTFDASAPVVTAIFPWIPKQQPKKYHVSARCCNNSQALDVHAYPGTELDYTLDLKKTAKWLYTIIKGIEFAVELAAEKWEWKIAEGRGSVTAQWKEYTDWRAYYGYKIAAKFDPLYGIEAKITLGTSWLTKKLKLIPWLGKYLQKAIDWLIKAGAYLKLSGGVTCEIAAERNSPDQPLYPTQPSGGVGGKIGAAIGVEANVIGDKVISIEIEGGGAVTAGGKPFVDDRGFGLDEFKVDFDGIKLSIKLKLADGWLGEITETFTVIDPDTLWGPEKVYFTP